MVRWALTNFSLRILRMSFTQANGINIYYEQQGQGEDLVIINGLSADHASWQLVLPFLKAHYRVTVFDNRGAGQTDAPDEMYSIEQMADDTAALMDALSIEKAHIIGHSMGGMIAEQLAIHHPEKVNKLMIVCSMASPYPRGARWLELLEKQRRAGVSPELIVETAVLLCCSNQFVSKQGNIDVAIATALANPHPQTAIGNARQLQPCVNYDGLSSLHQIPHQTLVIGGEEDILTPVFCAEAIADAIQNATLKIIPGAHMPNVEQPEALAKLLVDFIH